MSKEISEIEVSYLVKNLFHVCDVYAENHYCGKAENDWLDSVECCLWDELEDKQEFSYFTFSGHCHPSYARRCVNALIALIQIDKGDEILCSEDMSENFITYQLCDESIPF